MNMGTTPSSSRNASTSSGYATAHDDDGKSAGVERHEEHVRLLVDVPDEEDTSEHKRAAFRRTVSRSMSFRRKQAQRRPSYIGAASFFRRTSSVASAVGGQVEPYVALAPLVSGRRIHGSRHPKSWVKSTPAFAPYRRTARHRSFYLWWLNEFRHWWKSSRLLVRLGGLAVMAHEPETWMRLTTLKIWKPKGPKRGAKMFKRLGQGGVMRPFLKVVHPFTRTLRIVVAVWRWIEAAKCRRGEVGVEEAMAFIGNRVSRFIARDVVDFFGRWIVFPIVVELIDWRIMAKTDWHPAVCLIVLGIIRAISPYAASFQGSRFGRVVTRATFAAAGDRWQPTMRIGDMNMQSTDCNEGDEVSNNADLVKLAKKVATALGKDSSDTACTIDKPHRTNVHMEEVDFHQVGCGSGGYAVYAYERGLLSVLLHVTPYGPSILDEMPRYVVLEREESQDTRGEWSDYLSQYLYVGPRVVEGYCYKGAFFSPYQWAELTERYDAELLAYSAACKAMCKKRLGRTQAVPPTDLQSLKAFVEMGRPGRLRNKHSRRYHQLLRVVRHLAADVKSKMNERSGRTGKPMCVAPAGVILYFEGLDCAGKSSTGGLVQAALEQAGYETDLRQYNRPPTAEEKAMPWMDRFERPNTQAIVSTKGDEKDEKNPFPLVSTADADVSEGDADGEEEDGKEKAKPACVAYKKHKHSCMIWDRGPVGDFVYGALAHAPESEKKERYDEFMEFDEQCRRNNVLFCKLFFVTNRDAIARTLGKRLAQKKICSDLHTWLDASTGQHGGEVHREGLDEIDLHIDPSDFVAFNSYHDNLDKFSNVVRNTDVRADSTWDNPWLVISTGNRHPARIQLLKRFRVMLDRFTFSTEAVSEAMSDVMDLLGVRWEDETKEEYPVEMVEKDMGGSKELKSLKKGLNKETLIGIMIILLMVYFYINRTYDFDVSG